MKRSLIQRLERRQLFSSSFTWEMVPTYGVDNDKNGLIDVNSNEVLGPNGYLARGRFPVRFKYTGGTPITSMSYYIDGANFPADLLHSVEAPGANMRVELPEGVYDVLLRGYGTSGIVAEETQRILVDNKIIVSLGDSYASGEGNPETAALPFNPAVWADDPIESSAFTHRTSLAASSRAAIDLEQADPHSSVSFIFLAQTGAQLSGNAEGKDVLPDNDPTTLSQLERLKNIVGNKTIDQLIISIGGNDIGFSDAIATMISNLNNPSTLPDTSGFSKLAAKYSALDDWIDQNLSVRNVYLQQYPNALKDQAGTYPIRQAGDIALNGAGLEITAWESQWAETNLINRLTSIESQAAREAKDDVGVTAAARAANPSVDKPWIYIDTISDKFAHHGYAAPAGYEDNVIPNVTINAGHPKWEMDGTAPADVARWIRTATESRSLQEPAVKSMGIFHPNTLGQIAIGQELEKAMNAHPAITPVADAGGPYNVAVGTALTVTAAAAFPSDATRQAATVYTWDLDGDGVFGESASHSIGNELGRAVTLNSSSLTAGVNRTLRVHVYDPIDSTEAYANAALAVNPATPVVTLTVPSTSEEGVPTSIAFDVLNSSNYREHYITSLLIDWGDGSTESVLVAGQAQYLDLGNGRWGDRFLIQHTFLQRGVVRTVSVRAVEQLYADSGTRTWGPYTGKTSVVAPIAYGGLISGRVVWDQYPDAAFTTAATAANGWRSDSGLSLPVYVDSNDNGIRDLGERWAQPDADGYYTITSVAPGTYRVRVDRGSGGWYSAYFTNRTANGIRITVGTAASLQNDFYLTLDAPLRATVSRWIDTDGDGVQDYGEVAAIAGVPVLFDVNGNRRADGNERVVLTDDFGNADVFIYDTSASYSTVLLLDDPSLEVLPDFALANGSFENTASDGYIWSNLGGSYGGTTGVVNSGSIGATDGGSFKSLTTGDPINGSSYQATGIASTLGITAAALNAMGDPALAATEGEGVYRSIYARAGSIISFDWDFLTTAAAGGPADFAFVGLSGTGGKTFIELSNVTHNLAGGVAGDFTRSSGWQSSVLTVPSDGYYTLGFAVLDDGTTAGDSALLLDNVQLIGTPASTIYPMAYGESAYYTVRAGTSVVSGNAWVDTDQNGVRSNSEPSLSGVSALLIAAGPDNLLGTADDREVGRTTTDAGGNYRFASVASGIYGVRFVPLTGTDFTAALAGTDRSADSDADPTTGRTSAFGVSAKGSITFVSAGFRTGAVGVNVTSTGSLGATNTSESGGSVTLRISLTAKPTAPVTLALWSNDVDEGAVSVPTLTFDTADWNIAQIVTVAGVDDSFFDGPVNYAVQIDPLVSADPRYSGLAVAPISLTNLDNEHPLTADPLDPNEAPLSATVLVPGAAFSRSDVSIWKRGDQDWFRWTATRTGKLAVSLAFLDSLGDLDVAVYAGNVTDPSAATPIAISDQIGSNTEAVSLNVVAGQSYLVRVQGATPFTTNPQYTVALGVQAQLVASRFTYDSASPHVELQFDTPVAPSLSLTDFSFLNVTTGRSVSITSVTPLDSNTLSVGWGSTALPDGNYRLTVAGGAIRTPDGIATPDSVTAEFFAMAGDANHDRKVDFSDLLILARNYGSSGRSFAQANFDYSTDGVVGFGDLLILARNFGRTLAASSPEITVAAPSSIMTTVGDPPLVASSSRRRTSPETIAVSLV